MDTVGFHYIVEASGCNEDIISNAELISEILIQAAKKGDMDIKTSYFYKFMPKGVSGFVIVAESHISIHTWPEKRYAAIDVYVCGNRSKPEKTIDYILEALDSNYAHVSEVKRGVQDDDVYTHIILTWEEDLKSGIP
jgi:S-adenosylmethionine decarboxylase